MHTIVFYLTVFFSLPLFGNLSTPNSASDWAPYRECCKQAAEDDFVFANFKRDPRYHAVLEHLGKDTGIPYLNMIRNQTPEFFKYIEVFRRNDIIGNPRTDHYDDIGTISTTTIRYMKVASDLKVLFGSLKDASIIEIGGGYGGQCLILSYLNKFKSYTLVDLPEPLALAKKYLDRHGVKNVTYKRYDESFSNHGFDLVISNHAFNECIPKMREKYIKEIFSHSKRGYITGTKGDLTEEIGINDPVNFLKKHGLSCEEMPEVPLTHPENIILIWGKAKK